MKRQLSLFAAAAVFIFLAAPAWAQFTAIHGKCTDRTGQPIVGAHVQMADKNTGRHYDLKTDKKGEYFSLGVAPGTYKITLLKDNQVLYFLENVPVSLGAPDGVNQVNFDLAKEQAPAPGGAAAPAPGRSAAAAPAAPVDISKMTPEQQKAYEQKMLKAMTPEQRKAYEQQQAENSKIEKYNTNVKAINAKLNEAATEMKANNFQGAISALTEANTIDPNHDLVWGRLGDAYIGAKQYPQAADAYKKAIDIASQKPPEKQDKQALGAYENQYATALAQQGQVDEAVAEYNKAAALDPAAAARYYFNEGAIMTNVGSRTTDPTKHAAQLKAANDAFDKAIAADPKYAEAYFQKGANGVNMATMDKNGKTVVPPGTAEAFQKYLELAPNGPHADEAKQLLAALGEQIQTTFKGGKKK